MTPAIPMEVGTLGAATLIGGGLKIASQVWAEKARREAERDRFIANRDAEHKSNMEAARAFVPEGGPWARRLIVVACVVAMISPALLPAFFEGLSVSYAYIEQAGGWWIFQTSLDTLKTKTFEGIVILPLHTHTCAAVSGFYFGAGIAKWRRWA